MSYTEISSSYPKGKKEYFCSWCGQSIPEGEKHFKRAYKFCGDFISDRMHLECKAAMEKTPGDELADGWTHGDMERGRRDEGNDEAKTQPVA
jgi:hypothetical protein